MNKIHPKVIEYLLKSYYYVGFSSYNYLLENLEILPLSKEFDLEKEKEKWRENFKEEAKGISSENLEKVESESWDLTKKERAVYDSLYLYLKSLSEEDIYNLLLVLLPDTRFNLMKSDNWNYYGEFVKDWHSNLFHYLELSGIKYDPEKKQLVSLEGDLETKRIIAKQDLISIDFNDVFYRDLKDEINRCYRTGSYTASFILSRKLIENLVIDILRKKFPPNDENVNIYYRPKDKRFHDLTVLLKKLEEMKNEFGIDEEFIDEFIKYIKPFRPLANSNAHSIVVWGKKKDLDELQIEKIIGLLKKILENLENEK